MAQKIKIFEAGTWNGQEFSNEEVERIFGGVESSDAVYMHTSNWQGEGKDPLKLGSFKGFEVLEEEGVKKVFALPEYNDKGIGYKEDGIFKGVSVELNDDNTELLRTALLPLSSNPAVEGAGYSTILEFEAREFEEDEDKISTIKTLLSELDITKLTDNQILGIQDIIWAISDETYYIEQLKKKGYAVTSEMQQANEFEGKTPQEISEIVSKRTIKEFQEKQSKKDGAKSWIEENKLRITPAMETAGLTLEFAEKLSTNKGEFAEDINTTFKKIVEALPKINTKGLNHNEFEGKEEETEAEKAYKAAQDLLDIYKK